MAKQGEIVRIWNPKPAGKGSQTGLLVEPKWADDPQVIDPKAEDLYGYLGHVLTWHNLEVGDHGNIRVWIHSLSRSRIKREILSIQIEMHGTVFPDVEEREAELRMMLAKRTSSFSSESKMKSTLLRDLPSGKTFELHSKILDSFFASLFDSTGNVIDLKSASGRKKGRQKDHSSIEIRTTAKDAILIAKLYALRTEMSGASRAAKRIHDEYGIQLSTIYTAIRLSRAKGWLQKGDRGVAGGVMTPEGEKFFIENNGPERLEALTGIKIGNR